MQNDAAIRDLLLAMPEDGGWTPGAGPHRDVLMILLDDGSPLIEENVIETDSTPWMVRMTPAGQRLRNALVVPGRAVSRF